MSVLDTVGQSGDQGNSKDTAIVSSTGEAQVLMVEESLKQLALDMVPVIFHSVIYSEGRTSCSDSC